MVLTETTAPEVRPYSAGAFVVRTRKEATPWGEGSVPGEPVEATMTETPFNKTSVLSVRLPLIESCEVFGVSPAPPCAAQGMNSRRFSVARPCSGRFCTPSGEINVEMSKVQNLPLQGRAT